MTGPTARLLGRGSWPEAQRIAAVLRKETVGGALLLVAAAVALVWANSPWACRLRDAAGHPRRAPRRCTSTFRSARGRPTACSRSSSSSPGSSSSASSSPVTCASHAARRCRSPRRSAAWPCRRCFFVLFNLGRPGGRAARLGDPVGDRHRVRPRRPRGDQHAPAERAAHVPADPGRGRRPAGHRRHRDLLHRRRCRSASSLLSLLPLALFGFAGAAADPLVVAAAAARRAHVGAHARVRACTPPSPACCWPSPCRWCAARRPAARTPGRGSPSTSSTGSGRCRRASPSRCSRSSPPAWPSAASPGSAPRSTDSVAIGIMVGLVAGKAIGISAATWLVVPVHPGAAGREPRLARRRRAVPARRHRLHRLAADHRARLRRRERALRPRQGRHPRRHPGRRPAGRRSSCGCATGGTGGSHEEEQRRRSTGTASPTSISGRSPTADNSGCRAAFGRRTVVVHERGGGP